jgi:hypothetical protein
MHFSKALNMPLKVIIGLFKESRSIIERLMVERVDRHFFIKKKPSYRGLAVTKRVLTISG